jgi:hypothetical protein
MKRKMWLGVGKLLLSAGLVTSVAWARQSEDPTTEKTGSGPANSEASAVQLASEKKLATNTGKHKHTPQLSRHFAPKVRSKALDRLVSSNVSVQTKAAIALFKEIDSGEPRQYLNHQKNLLPYLQYMLGDANPTAANASAGCLWILADRVHDKKNGRIPPGSPIATTTLEPEDFAPLKEILIYSLRESPYPRVQSNSARVLALVFKPTVEIEQALVDRFTAAIDLDEVREATSSALLNMLIPRGELEHFQTPDTLPALVAAIGDKNTEVSGTAAEIVGRFKPPGILPQLMARLPSVMADFGYKDVLSVVSEYGVEAEPYLPQLKELITVANNDEGRRLLQHTIDQVAPVESKPDQTNELKGQSSNAMTQEYARKLRHAFAPEIRPEDLDRLLSSDITVQRDALIAFAKEINGGKLGQYLSHGKTLLPYLEQMLVDPTPEAADVSATVLWMLALVTKGANRNEFSAPEDFPPLKETLLYSLWKGPTEKVQHMSALVLALSYKPTLEMEQSLTARFISAKGLAYAREGIIKGLADMLTPIGELEHFQSPDTLPALVAAIGYREDRVSFIAAHLVSRFKPYGILPQLMERLPTVIANEDFQDVLSVMVEYGAEAKPYVSRLNELMSKTKDEKRQQLLQRAIDQIQKADIATGKTSLLNFIIPPNKMLKYLDVKKSIQKLNAILRYLIAVSPRSGNDGLSNQCFLRLTLWTIAMKSNSPHGRKIIFL